MRAWRPILAMLLPILAGCQPPPHDIIATIKGSDLVFGSSDRGFWPFKKKDNVETAQDIEVRDGDLVVWRIERDANIPGCASAVPVQFPLTYNRIPRCYRATVPSRGLRHGVDYVVTSSSPDSISGGYGMFRVRDSVDNL